MDYWLYLLVLQIGINLIKCSSDVKGSLTFVIDDTFSMSDDIGQVKINANDIFDTVMNSNSSQIEDFVLVTFNDPGVSLRTVTKDRETFKTALNGISVHGGDDCPEMAMGGIELALQNSREASLLYVFTDASAKDHEMLAKVKALCVKKRSQVVFVLTGDCGDRRSSQYLAYHELARATQGQVFQMKKNEIGNILEYVKNTIKNRQNVFASKTYPAGYGNKFDVNVDGDTKELVISVAGVNPSVGLTDSVGTKVPTEDITRLFEVAVVKVRGVKPGVYKVEVGSASETSVVVSGSTTVHFQHGFSVFEPTAIADTATRPVPGEKSHVSIKLSTDGGRVDLKSLQLLDMDDNVMLEVPLRLVDDAQQFYTTDPVLPPNHLFRIAIKGYHRESKSIITRISLTPIQPQDSPKVAVLEKAPSVAIDGSDKVEAKHNERLQLKCKVSGFPRPDVIWESDDPTAVLSHTESVVELPYEYISFLHIKNVQKSSVYTCKAVNKLSTDSKSITVEVKSYFNILEIPHDTIIEYKMRGEVFCKVDASPAASVSWYRGRWPLAADAGLHLAADNSSLIISSMEPRLAGGYMCEIKNDFNTKTFPFTVDFLEKASSVTIDGSDKVEAKHNERLELKCKISGFPRPEVIWESDDPTAVLSHTESVVELPYKYISFLHIRSVKKSSVYTCKAVNKLSTDSKSITVEVKSYFNILEIPHDTTIEYKMRGEVFCKVDASPAASVSWYRGRRPLAADAGLHLAADNSSLIISSMEPRLAGGYMCEIKNDFNTKTFPFTVDFLEKAPSVAIDGSDKVEAKHNERLQLKCKISGFPRPDVIWESDDPTAVLSHTESVVELPYEYISFLHIRSVKKSSVYTCKAVNKLSTDSKSITVEVKSYFNILEIPHDTTIEYKMRGEVFCKVDASPAASVSWYRGRRPLAADAGLHLAADNSSLIISSMEPRLAGGYMCEIKNDFNTKTFPFTVDFLEKAPSVAIDGSDKVEAKHNERLQLKCKISGFPRPDVIWESDDPTAVLSHTESVVELPYEYISFLHIRSVKKSSVYTCKAVNKLSTDSKSITVEVKSYFNILEIPHDTTIEYKMRGEVFCKVDASPAASVSWYRGRRPLAADVGLHLAADNSSLIISSMEPRLAGGYMCEIKNDFNTKTFPFTVDFLEKAPSVAIDGSDKVEAKHNERLQLKCKISGFPRPDVIWESDDPTAVLSHTESVVELPYEYISFLHIKNLKKSSVYTCKAVNKLSTDSKSITVEVKSYFNILEKPHDTAIEYKMRGEVFCKVDASPAASVSWYRGRRPLAADAGLHLAADNSSLIISSMEPRLAGGYMCEIRNDYHRRVFPFSVSITGVDAPKINKNFYYIEALRHSNVNITCNVFRGKPAPTVTWFYAGAEVYSPRGKFTKLNETASTIRIDDVGMEHNGVFRCIVENVVGKDFHDIDLVVQYPPFQTASASARVLADAGGAVMLPCPADGAPPPAYTWRRDSTALPPTGYTLFRNGSLKFTASLNDSGDYECTAENDHGAIHVNLTLEINEPVSIEPPASSRVSAVAGAALPPMACRARGRPAPRIVWLFHSRDPGVAPAQYAPSDPSGTLHIRRIKSTQDGFYTCVASNVAGSKNITYTVSVLVPPSISYSAKQFVGVAGDVQLGLPCRAAGRPAPTVTWSRDGYPVPVGSRWYAVDADGTLLLRDLDARAAGRYVCRAENSLGAVNEAFDAVVLPSPAPAPPGAPLWLEEGQSAVVTCNVPHQKTDRLLWFKDGHTITDGELELKNVSRHDAGLYACRVSSLTDARTGSTQVEVGWKPRFSFNDEKYIEFEIGNIAFMSCDATGEPEPEVLWFHDDVPLYVTSFTHDLEMTGPGDRGRYSCIVSNKFGTTHREFEIDTLECALDVKKDFDGNEPLMLTRYLELHQFETSDGHVRIRRGETIALICPAGFQKLSQNIIRVKCVNGKQFVAEDDDRQRFSYSDLKCRHKIIPEVKRTGRRCTDGGSEMMSVGFQVPGLFIEVYQICLDRATKTTIYTKQVMTLSQANVIPEYDIKWFDNGSATNLDRLYDCSYQNRRISSILSKDFHGGDGCCFAPRQLVSPRDVAPGLPQTATYATLNVAAQWGTCNSQNWEEVEARVRGLTQTVRRPLPVWSGAARALRLHDAAAAPRDVVLSDGRVGHKVPEFFWKVVQDPARNASLAVVQVNVPDLDLRDAARYRLCEDVCSEVDWMRNRRWRELARGYTYCCRLPEFERAFRLQGAFPPRRALLRAASYLADSSALHL